MRIPFVLKKATPNLSFEFAQSLHNIHKTSLIVRSVSVKTKFKIINHLPTKRARGSHHTSARGFALDSQMNPPASCQTFKKF